jgi:signal transduction histidine kinase
MDTMITGNLEKALNDYLQSPAKLDRSNSAMFQGYPVSRGWAQQPEDVRLRFAQPPGRDGVLYKVETPSLDDTRLDVYFVLRQQIGDETWFISHRLSHQTVSQLVHENVMRHRDSLILISLGSVVVLALLFWLALRSISKPVTALSGWTHGLDPESLKQPIPDFAYPELNEMARLIRSSLSSVQQSLEREHRFLRHTSHELRTPISVLRSNVELIRRLDKDGSAQAPERRSAAVERIDRASLTMMNLTETLLWLGREDDQSLPRQPIALNTLLKTLTDDMRYLLQGKPVEVELLTEEITAELPETPARIVIGNLIRNAFQHTWEGRVKISQRGMNIEVVNPVPEKTDDSADLGFGLGLQLTEQLCDRLGWSYSSSVDADGYRAVVLLNR